MHIYIHGAAIKLGQILVDWLSWETCVHLLLSFAGRSFYTTATGALGRIIVRHYRKLSEDQLLSNLHEQHEPLNEVINLLGFLKYTTYNFANKYTVAGKVEPRQNLVQSNGRMWQGKEQRELDAAFWFNEGAGAKMCSEWT